MKRWILWLGLTLAVIGRGAEAQDAQAPTNMLTPPDATCAAWVKSEDNRTVRAAYVYWFRGFISGYNWGNQARQVSLDKLPNNAAVIASVDKFCRERPNELFSMAAPVIVRDLLK